jgi:hypothetical protein
MSEADLLKLITIGAISNRHPSRTDALFVATK